MKKLLYENNDHYPLLKSIIAHAIEGRIFVDQLEDCQSAFLMNKNGWVYFLGREENENFNKRVEEVLKSDDFNSFESIIWFGISDYWRERVQQRLTTDIKDYPRMQYLFKSEEYPSTELRDCPYEIVGINEDNIQQSMEFNNSIIDFWETKERFLQKGFGYLVLDKGKIISQSISASIEDGEVEIDIMTDESYRGKGLAKLVAIHLIDQCLEKALIPKWDCSVSNKASSRLADKLGFKPIGEYNLSLFKL